MKYGELTLEDLQRMEEKLRLFAEQTNNLFVHRIDNESKKVI